jgi:AraC-like DNA-binding protein
LFVRVLDERGLGTDELLARCGLRRDDFHCVEGRLRLDDAQRFVEEVGRTLGDPDVGLTFGSQGPLGDGVVLYAVRCCATLGDAYRTVSRLHRLITEVGRVELEEEGDRARLALYTPPNEEGLGRHFAEMYLGLWLRGARELTGVHWNPTAVRFRHPEPARLDAHRALFAAPLFFDQSRDELEFDPRQLELPLRTAEPTLARILEGYGVELLARLPPADDFPVAVRRAVASSLGSGEPTLEHLAGQFNLTPRTLQRRLSSQGLSLRGVIDDERHQLALRHMERRDLSLAEVAFMLGFDAVTSFHRAFRRWTGQTPADYREQLGRTTK